MHTCSAQGEPRSSHTALWSRFPELLPLCYLRTLPRSLRLPFLVLWPQIWSFSYHFLPHVSWAVPKSETKQQKGRETEKKLDFTLLSWDYREKGLIKEKVSLPQFQVLEGPTAATSTTTTSTESTAWGPGIKKTDKNNPWDFSLHLSLIPRAITRGPLEFSPFVPWCPLCLCLGFRLPWVQVMGYQGKNEKFTASVMVRLILVFPQSVYYYLYFRVLK